MRLLLVEDDPMIGAAVRRGLQQEGYAVDWLRDGKTAAGAFDSDAHAAVLLDLGLPGSDGLEVLRTLRRCGHAVPVLILTARDAVSDRVAGLDAGADDYLVKPFSLEELAARVRALLRRLGGRAEITLRHGPLSLDPARHEARLNGELLALSAREFALLEVLMQRPGVVMSVAALQEKIYGWDEDIGSNTIEVYIHSLRKKIGAGLIRNVRGAGYTIPE